MRNGYLDPAYTIIEKLGGLSAAAEAAGVDESRVCRWRLPKGKPHDGTGGLVPSKHHQRILDWAARHERDLGPADFFASRPRRRGEGVRDSAAA
jgi:hypothetical protein